MAIAQSFIQELLARTDVVEVVGRYVQLKKGGANFMGLCPFHGEKSPSFSVSPVKQFYHCFGCGKSGDALNFLMEHTGMSFVEAVKDLAQQVGLVVPEDDQSPQERERASAQRARQATLTEVLEKAGEAYRAQLKTSARAVQYLKGRGLSGEVARRFGLGYAPEGWRSLASVFAHYDDPLLVESGLVIVNEDEDKRYDRFRDRIMFPIRNVQGECIGFGGRVLGDEKPKYMNSPETPVFSKGRELYGLFEARQALREAGYALVTEGYMDVVALAQLGFANAVATLGTACTPEHVHKLLRFTDAVVFSFDGDSAGRRAARKALDGALPYATDVRSIKFLFLPPEHDPDSFIRSAGREAFARLVSEATPLSRFLVDSAREGCDPGSAEGRARLASNARPLWSALPDGALKRQLLSELATLVQLEARDLHELWTPPPSGHGAPHANNKNNSNKRPPNADSSQFLHQNTGFRPPRNPGGGRLLPNSRADHAVRLLLGHMSLWDELTGEEHTLLCALAPPHGPLLGWLEGQLHEHGPLPWGVLHESLQGHPALALAQRLMDSPAAARGEGAPEAPALKESRHELRDLLDRLLIEQLKLQENEALEGGDMQRYRELQGRRQALTVKQKTL